MRSSVFGVEKGGQSGHLKGTSVESQAVPSLCRALSGQNRNGAVTAAEFSEEQSSRMDGKGRRSN